jgi:hypothetical protein
VSTIWSNALFPCFKSNFKMFDFSMYNPFFNLEIIPVGRPSIWTLLLVGRDNSIISVRPLLSLEGSPVMQFLKKISTTTMLHRIAFAFSTASERPPVGISNAPEHSHPPSYLSIRPHACRGCLSSSWSLCHPRIALVPCVVASQATSSTTQLQNPPVGSA